MTDTSASAPRLIIPALGSIYSSLSDFAQAALRIGLGGILWAHGMQKLFGAFNGLGIAGNAAFFDKVGYSPGMFWGTLVGCTEFAGGVLLALGLFTRPAAFAVVIFLINAVYFTSGNGFFWTKVGSEYSILLLLVAFYILIHGGGPWSLDRKLGREL